MGADVEEGGSDAEYEMDGDVDRSGMGNAGKEENQESGSGSSESVVKSEGDRSGSSPKKKPRITLARGGACVACR
jgi:hypothetical protein